MYNILCKKAKLKKGDGTVRELHIEKNDAGQRLDKFLSKALPDMPPSFLYKALRLKKIKRNRKRADKADILAVGDTLQLFIPEDFFKTKEEDGDLCRLLEGITPRLSILYEDENIMLLNKRPGINVHEDKDGNTNTLITHIQSYLYKKGEYDPKKEQAFAPALCNRIDRNTGGIVIAAKNAEALRVMNDKIKNREIDKFYLCAVHGIPTPKEATLEGFLLKDETNNLVRIYKDKKSAALLKKNEGSLCGAQIFGNDPDVMAEGARLALEISGCDFLDINMGCPMPKIANSGDGCGLMRTPELAGNIVEAVVKAVDVPVTVKCRLGWDKGNINVLDFTKRMEDSGAAMVTVHGRTRAMLYSGTADWDYIRKVKDQLSIPVIANGDIVDAASALRCLKWTGADGIMIGRATFGDPWIFQQVSAAMAGLEVPERPVLKDRIAVAVKQFELSEADHGEHIACLEARKHFAWYLRGVRNASYYKKEITSMNKMEDIYRIAKDIVRDLE